MQWISKLLSQFKFRQPKNPSNKTIPTTVEQRQMAEALAETNLFHGCSVDELLLVANHFQIQDIPINTTFIREEDEPTDLCILLTGQAEVLKKDKIKQQQHRISLLQPGEIIGELALIEHSPRSATVRTTVNSSLLTIPIITMRKLLQANEHLNRQVYFNLAKQLNKRLKAINEEAVEALRQKLFEAKMRNSMGRFMVYTLLMIFLYVFTMRGISLLTHYASVTTIISVPMLFIFGALTFMLMKQNGLPLSTYGLTFKNFFKDSCVAILYSIPIMLLIVVLKWFAIHHFELFSTEPLFNNPIFGLNTNHDGLIFFTIMVICYLLAVPIQEILSRGAVQGSLRLFLIGPYKNIIAVLIANFVFSMIHLHFSIIFAAIVFPLGLFWGWLALKQNSIMGAIVSHMIVGIWAMQILGMTFLTQL